MNLRTALQILKLDSQATRGDVKQAYRKLAAQWHPDLHAQNPKLAPKAAKKMQEINNAYTLALGNIGTLHPDDAKRNTSSPTVLSSNQFSIFLLAAVACLVLVLLLLFLFHSRSTGKTRISSSSQTRSTVTGQHRQIFKAIDFNHFNHEILKKAQLHLATIGFPTGKIDGIFGPQSMAAINKFHADFSLLSTIETPEDMLRILAVHAQIAAAHPKWRSIVQSDAFHTWLARPNISIQKQQRSFSSAPQLTRLFDQYTFTTTMPAVQPLPLTELLWQDAHYSTTRTITIVNKGTTRQQSFIKLIAADSKQELMYGFIRQGEQLTIPWPEKKCLLKLARGNQWYGKRFLFGPETGHGSIAVEQRKKNRHITLHLSSLVTNKEATPEGSIYNF